MVRRRGGDRTRSRQRGASRIGCLLALLLLVAGAYLGLQVAEGEIEYRSVREAARQQTVTGAERTDEEIREALLSRIRELELPARAREISIRRDRDGNVSISLAYADTVSFFDRWEWVRPRRVETGSGR